MTSPYFAYIEDFQLITVMVPLSYRDDIQFAFRIESESETIECELKHHQKIGDERQYILSFQGHVLLNETYYVVDDQHTKTPLKSGKIVRTPLFDDLFYYDGPLGIEYSPKATTFRVWSPIAKEMSLRLYNAKEEVIPMTYQNQGVWEVKVPQDLDGVSYDFKAFVNQLDTTFIDPYGIASTANGEKSVVIDLDKTYTFKHPKPAFSGYLTDAVIYEVSVRDLTYMLLEEEKSTFKGFTQTGLKTKKGSPAGFDYLKSLGITHIQLLPIFDFEGVDEKDRFKLYNWGYNPSQYNVPEGSFSSDIDDPYARINELKAMIDILHQAGFRVIMDVVYNHVYEIHTFPFEQIIPGYAFRVDDRGMMTNSSGCNNDLATERQMIRQFIIDSVTYWVKEYNIDGFRFDLMGLIDVTTMNRVSQTLDGIDKTLLLYGEGWKMPTPLPEIQMAHMDNPNVLFKIGFFNDGFRETIKGATFIPKALGFMSGGKLEPHNVMHAILGSTLNHRFKYPSQSLNYIECHDNYTVADKLKIALPDLDPSLRHQMQELGTAVVLLSQGVPFIHAGQEFFREKAGVENSYNASDEVNHINWDLVDDHIDAIERFKFLVKLRRNEPLFRLKTLAQIKKHTSLSFTRLGSVIYRLENDEVSYVILFKSKAGEEKVDLASTYHMIFDTTEKSTHQVSSFIQSDAITCIIAMKKKEL